jgi:hypothetical protein
LEKIVRLHNDRQKGYAAQEGNGQVSGGEVGPCVICGQPLTKPVVRIAEGLVHFACADQPAPPPAKKSRIRRGKPKFTATEDWHDVPPGAVLPPGLEVELDMSTGRQRARLPRAE